MSAEIRTPRARTRPTTSLQWGRARMSAEIAFSALWQSRKDEPSMGPRSDERGNRLRKMLSDAGYDLQWGRARMSAEMKSARAERSGAHDPFNGAALG